MNTTQNWIAALTTAHDTHNTAEIARATDWLRTQWHQVIGTNVALADEIATALYSCRIDLFPDISAKLQSAPIAPAGWQKVDGKWTDVGEPIDASRRQLDRLAADITWLATPPRALSPFEQSVVDSERARVQRKSELDRLARFATGHGHAVETDYTADCVRVGIQWINSRLGTRGTEWSAARNLSEMRDLLGY